MSEAIPQLDSAGDATDGMGADSAFVDAGVATDTSSGSPNGQPRAKNPEEKFQARYDKVVSQVGKLLSSDYLKNLGGDGIVRALEQFEAILEHPETANNVRQSLTQSAEGKWQYRPASVAKAARVDAESGYGTDDASAEDPLIRTMEARLDAKLAPFLERMSALQSRSETALAAGGEQKVADMTRRFKANYPMSPEETAEFAEAMSARIGRLDPSVLLKMNDEQFEEYVGLPSVKKFLPSIFARKAKQRGSQLAGLATDATSGTASLGAMESPAKPPKGETYNQLQKRLAAIAVRASQETA